MNKSLHSLFEYISEHILLVLVILLAIFSLHYVYDYGMRIAVVFLAAGLYIGYGFFHHQQEKTFNLSVALEYLSVASILGLVLLMSIR